MPPYRRMSPAGSPAPLVDVTFEWGGRDDTTVGLLDTGADQTQLPERMAQALRLRRIGEARTTDAHGRTEICPLYAANVSIEGFTFPSLPVVSSPLDIALIGRDILNELVAEFDGPSLNVSLERPAVA